MPQSQESIIPYIVYAVIVVVFIVVLKMPKKSDRNKNREDETSNK